MADLDTRKIDGETLIRDFPKTHNDLIDDLYDGINNLNSKIENNTDDLQNQINDLRKKIESIEDKLKTLNIVYTIDTDPQTLEITTYKK